MRRPAVPPRHRLEFVESNLRRRFETGRFDAVEFVRGGPVVRLEMRREFAPSLQTPRRRVTVG
ncbi:hypothetical protein CV102_22850 [Natronococcus pandeyae]|uniref:Uncharacterized protein n=1 Tax=Natronococcus pandeyae TaxID=2055836 RepID=A0A8J8PYU0_9EURY|nr:hypothetical protein CV102_22850 [Natronococcus pandeyae]